MGTSPDRWESRLMEGYCATCEDVVVVDGQQGDASGTVWSHLKLVTREVIVPGHAPGCWGNCIECPVPVLEMEQYVDECGPVYIGGD